MSIAALLAFIYSGAQTFYIDLLGFTCEEVNQEEDGLSARLPNNGVIDGTIKVFCSPVLSCLLLTFTLNKFYYLRQRFIPTAFDD